MILSIKYIKAFPFTLKIMQGVPIVAHLEEKINTLKEEKRQMRSPFPSIRSAAKH